MSLAFKIITLWLLVLGSSAALASDDALTFQSKEQEAVYRQLTAELRCPKCQNQNIADSHAVVAVDMRNKTYQLLQQGKSHDEVVDYMKQRYGDFVYYQPPVRASTIWLWLLPVLLVVVLALVAWRRTRPQTQQGMADQADATTAQTLQAMIDAATRGKQS